MAFLCVQSHSILCCCVINLGLKGKPFKYVVAIEE